MNYNFKTSWRYIRKNKASSIINIGGLAVGMAVALLIALWVWDEVSFDSYFANHQKIVQIMVTQAAEGQTYVGETITQPLPKAMRRDYPELFKKVTAAGYDYDAVFTVGEKKLNTRCMWTEADFTDIFSIRMLQGSRSALKDPSTILMSKSAAEKFFGKEDPINKTIRYGEKVELKVGGVMKTCRKTPHSAK